MIVERLREATEVVEPAIPLVGRIDVANYPGSLTYVGTGWLVDRDVVVTNRHVAEIIARAGDGKYHFRPGRFGEPMSVTLDYRHELGSDKATSARVSRVIWIEPDARKADIAFLEVARRTDGTRPEFITLAEQDARADSDVAVIGYPARAPAHIIPNQEWMEQIYGGNYDVKRIAPGLMRANNRGWATHDCTTLGGNSGSVVVDMKTGKAVALHFAGLYMIENYAVPASTIRKYLKDRPWHGGGEGASDTHAGQQPGGGAGQVDHTRCQSTAGPTGRDIRGRDPNGPRSGVGHNPADDHDFARRASDERHGRGHRHLWRGERRRRRRATLKRPRASSFARAASRASIRCGRDTRLNRVGSPTRSALWYRRTPTALRPCAPRCRRYTGSFPWMSARRR